MHDMAVPLAHATKQIERGKRACQGGGGMIFSVDVAGYNVFMSSSV